MLDSEHTSVTVVERAVRRPPLAANAACNRARPGAALPRPASYPSGRVPCMRACAGPVIDAALCARVAYPYIQTGKEREMGITDQVALNRLLDYQGLMPATKDDPRVLLLLNETLRLHPLPVLLFASGHVAFVQRLPWK